MARRRLEAAIRAGKTIQQETSVTFGHVDEQFKYNYDVDRDGIYSLQFSYDGAKLAVGYGDGTIEILDAKTGLKSSTVRVGGTRFLGVMVIRYHPKMDDIIVAGTLDGNVLIQSESSCRELLNEPGNQINCLDFNQDGGRFATAGGDRSIRIYDTQTLENVTKYEGNPSLVPANDLCSGHYQRIFALKYHPEDVHVFITAGWDNMLRIWDARTSTGLQRTIPGPHLSGDGLDIKANHILTASWVPSDALQLWDYRTTSLLQTLPLRLVRDNKSDDGVVVHAAGGDSGEKASNGAYLYCAQFCTGDVVIAGGSGTKSVQAIDRQSGQVLTEIDLKRSVYALDSAQNGRLIAAAGAGTRLLINVMS